MILVKRLIKIRFIVKWVPFETIIAGSFGKYNQLVAESLTDRGVEFKMFAS